LKNDRVLDAVVLGEGEYTLLELVQLLKEGSPDWKAIQGLAWRGEDGSIVINPHRKGLNDLNVMPFAGREKCLAAGCTEHLPKPIQTKELFEALSRNLLAN